MLNIIVKKMRENKRTEKLDAQKLFVFLSDFRIIEVTDTFFRNAIRELLIPCQKSCPWLTQYNSYQIQL